MTAELRVNATVTADGKQASAELRQVATRVGETKQALVEAQAATKAGAAALKDLARDANASAAAIKEARDAVVQQRAAEVLATASHTAAAGAAAKLATANDNLARSSGAARAAGVNLGQQVGDIAQGLSAGISPATIFAQQAGQVAFALNGLGGAAGKVGAFLAGPWGVAVTAAAVILTPLVSNLLAGDSAAEKLTEAQKDFADAVTRGAGPIQQQTAAIEAQTKALQAFDDQLARARKTQDQDTLENGRNAEARLKSARATRIQIAAEIDKQRLFEQQALARANDPTLAGEGGFNAGAVAFSNAAGNLRALDARAADNNAKILADEVRVRGAAALVGLNNVKEATDAAFAANERYRRSEADLVDQRTRGAVTQQQFEQRLLASQQQRDETLKKLAESERAAAKAARDATREANAETRERQRLIERLYAAPGRIGSDLIAQANKVDIAGIVRRNDAEDSRDADRIKIRNTRDELGDIFETSARRMTRQLLEDADTIGAAIGGRAGNAISRAASLISAGRTGDLSIAGQTGGVGSLLSLFGNERLTGKGFSGAVREGFNRSSLGVDGLEGLGKALSPLKPMADAILNVFGDDGRGFARLIGGAAGGAATGELVGQLAGLFGGNAEGAGIGGSIGGAIGAATGIPGLDLIGSIIGAVIGPTPRAFRNLATDATGRVVQSDGGARGAGRIDRRGQAIEIAGGLASAVASLTGQFGARVRPGSNLGAIGSFKDEFEYRTGPVDRLANSIAGGQTLRFDTAAGAVSGGIRSIIERDLIIGLSPRVKAALTAYADDINAGMADALKVQTLEDLLADRANQFSTAFRDLEQQLGERLDIARRYGFDVVEIEKINAEERAKAIEESVRGATGSLKNLLQQLTIGAGATGSISERIAGLGTERDRLTGLIRGGDTSQSDELAGVLQQIDALQRQAFGSTGQFATGRDSTVALLNEVLSSVEEQAKRASETAKTRQEELAAASVGQLREANSSLDDLQRELAASNRSLSEIFGLIASFYQPLQQSDPNSAYFRRSA